MVTAPLAKIQILTTENATTSKEAHNGTKKMDDKKEAVVTAPFRKKTLFTTQKVATSEDNDKGTKNPDDMKKGVVTIRWKDLNHFEGRYKESRSWFNFDHEFLSRKISTLEPDFYKKIIKRILKVKIWTHIKRFSTL